MPYLRPDGVLCDYAVPFATIAMDEMPPGIRARKNKPNGTTPMPTRRPAMARDASPDDADMIPKSRGVVARMIAELRKRGSTDAEIIEILTGTASADIPPDPDNLAQDAAAFRSRWGDGASVSFFGIPCRSREMAADSSTTAGFDRRWGRLCGERA